MIVQQVAFDVPPELAVGLASGAYSRFGSVVRDSTSIIAHLKEVEIPEEQAKSVVEALKANKLPVAIGLGVVLVIGTTAAFVVHAARKRSRGELSAPAWLEEYNSALTSYLDGIRVGSLDSAIIGRLIAALDNVKAHAAGEGVDVLFSAEQAETLVGIVVEFTNKLAAANDADVKMLESSEPESTAAAIVDLRHYLEIQKGIFDRAA